MKPLISLIVSTRNPLPSLLARNPANHSDSSWCRAEETQLSLNSFIRIINIMVIWEINLLIWSFFVMFEVLVLWVLGLDFHCAGWWWSTKAHTHTLLLQPSTTTTETTSLLSSTSFFIITFVFTFKYNTTISTEKDT